MALTGTPTKWGIASSGKICGDFANALRVADTKEQHKVVAVAARSHASAKEFADKYGIPRAYGGYEQLAADKEVEVVYIGSINPAHLSMLKLLIGAGKHILCEKPMGTNVKETKEMLALAKEKGVFLMEAMWAWFNPTHNKLREELANGRFGQVFQANVTFGLPLAGIDRVSKKALGGGAVNDIGIYTVYFSQLVHNRQKPTKIIATGHLNSDGVDESVGAVLTYDGERTTNITLHNRVTLPCEAEVFGTKGSAKIHFPFWAATDISFDDGKEKISYKVNESDIPFNFHNSAFLANEAQHVRECLLKGLKESPVVSHQDTMNASEIMESIRRQLGVKYEQDDWQ